MDYRFDGISHGSIHTPPQFAASSQRERAAANAIGSIHGNIFVPILHSYLAILLSYLV
jgi:hypothetical protein